MQLIQCGGGKKKALLVYVCECALYECLRVKNSPGFVFCHHTRRYSVAPAKPKTF